MLNHLFKTDHLKGVGGLLLQATLCTLDMMIPTSIRTKTSAGAGILKSQHLNLIVLTVRCQSCPYIPDSETTSKHEYCTAGCDLITNLEIMCHLFPSFQTCHQESPQVMLCTKPGEWERTAWLKESSVV